LKIFEVECSKGLKLKVQIQFKFKSCSVQIHSKFSSHQSCSVLFRNSVQVQFCSVQVQFKLKGELQGRIRPPRLTPPDPTAGLGGVDAAGSSRGYGGAAVTERFEVSLKVTPSPDPPAGKMAALAPASRAMAAARCCAPLTPAHARRRTAVRWVGWGAGIHQSLT